MARSIIYECDGAAWVEKCHGAYRVWTIGITHSTSDCDFPLTVSGLSLAICRAFYHYHKKLPEHCLTLPASTCLMLAERLHQGVFKVQRKFYRQMDDAATLYRVHEHPVNLHTMHEARIYLSKQAPYPGAIDIIIGE